MKKLSKDERLNHIRHITWRERKKTLRKRKLSPPTRKVSAGVTSSELPHSEVQQQSHALSRDGRVLIEAPEVLCLAETRHETLIFLRALRQFGLRNKEDIRLDLSATNKVSSSAMLLLYALVDSILINSGNDKQIVMSYPTNIVTEEICQQVGLLDRLGMVSRRDPNQFSNDVSRWKVAYGHLFDAKELYEFILDILTKASPAMVSPYNKGLKEAIGNCIEHAYAYSSDQEQNSALSKWWMFGGLVDGSVVFSVCDLGLGIPRTLHMSNNMQEVRSWIKVFPRKFDLKSDKGRIEVACSLGRSRHGKRQGRGKGLAQLVSLMNNGGPDSRLAIYSNKGMVYFEGTSNKPYKAGLSQSVMGTIIEWSCPIENFNISDLPIEI